MGEQAKAIGLSKACSLTYKLEDINNLHKNIKVEKDILVTFYWVYDFISLNLYFFLKLESEGQHFISDSRLFHNFGPLYLIVVREKSYLNEGI